MARIEAPVKENGEVTGVGGLIFTDGVAETDDPAIIAYCRGAGYTVDGEQQEVPDPSDETSVGVLDTRETPPSVGSGTRLRDAAVDPDDRDFLVPEGAGEHDPHGPDVIAPGIHANEDVRPLKGKRVGTASQQDNEEAAQSRRTPRSR